MGLKALQYAGGKTPVEITVASGDVEPASYQAGKTYDEAIAAVLATLNASGVRAVFHEMGNTGSRDRYRSITLTGTFEGDNDTVVEEDHYLVQPSELNGILGVRCEKVADVTWTVGSAGIAEAACGLESQKAAKAVACVTTNLLEGRVDRGPRGVSLALGSNVEIPDDGNSLGVLRVAKLPASGAATKIVPACAMRTW